MVHESVMGMKSKLANLISDYKRYVNSNSLKSNSIWREKELEPYAPVPTPTKTNSSSVLLLYGTSPADQEGNEVYENLQRVVGVGAKCSVGVWRCRSHGKLVAVKEFCQRSPGETRDQQIKSIALEFQIGITCHHANVIKVTELIQAQKRWYQVMEYAPYDLYEAVKTRSMASAEINCTFRQIIAGLAYMHARGFAHRDMKLDNVMLNQFGIVKIVDFGSAVASETTTSKGDIKVPAFGV